MLKPVYGHKRGRGHIREATTTSAHRPTWQAAIREGLDHLAHAWHNPHESEEQSRPWRRALQRRDITAGSDRQVKKEGIGKGKARQVHHPAQSLSLMAWLEALHRSVTSCHSCSCEIPAPWWFWVFCFLKHTLTVLQPLCPPTPGSGTVHLLSALWDNVYVHGKDPFLS